jgi:hypothetical protein
MDKQMRRLMGTVPGAVQSSKGVVDPVLAQLSAQELDYIEDQLSNNETANDDELRSGFIANGLTPDQADRALTYRQQYLIEIYWRGTGPIYNYIPKA